MTPGEEEIIRFYEDGVYCPPDRAQIGSEEWIQSPEALLEEKQPLTLRLLLTYPKRLIQILRLRPSWLILNQRMIPLNLNHLHLVFQLQIEC